MKKFSLLISTLALLSLISLSLSAVVANANVYNDQEALPKDAISLSKASMAKIVSAQLFHPHSERPDFYPQPATAVTIRFTLKGCMDELATFSYDVRSTDNNKHEIIVSAVNVHTEKSKHVRCFKAKEVDKVIYTRPFLHVEDFVLTVME
ncbi:MAG: hypothetical protein HQK49_11390 [Oligoflexia bacterium]|nr:hypothetical protein [Oligoflexia bacterium]